MSRMLSKELSRLRPRNLRWMNYGATRNQKYNLPNFTESRNLGFTETLIFPRSIIGELIISNFLRQPTVPYTMVE